MGGVKGPHGQKCFKATDFVHMNSNALLVSLLEQLLDMISFWNSCAYTYTYTWEKRVLKFAKKIAITNGGDLKNPHGFFMGVGQKTFYLPVSMFVHKGEGDQKCSKICPHGLWMPPFSSFVKLTIAGVQVSSYVDLNICISTRTVT